MIYRQLEYVYLKDGKKFLTQSEAIAYEQNLIETDLNKIVQRTCTRLFDIQGNNSDHATMWYWVSNPSELTAWVEKDVKCSFPPNYIFYNTTLENAIKHLPNWFSVELITGNCPSIELKTLEEKHLQLSKQLGEISQSITDVLRLSQTKKKPNEE